MTTLCNTLRSKPHTITGIVLLSLLALASTTLFAQTETEDEMEQTTQPATNYRFTTVNAPGASATLAYGINNSGKIAGYFTGGECSKVSDQASCGFIDVKGKFTTVACELENATDFFDISNASQVIGAYSFFGGVHGLIWEGNEGCFDIVAPEGPSLTEAWGVNASGLVVGFYQDSAGSFRGFVYDKGKYTNIECAGWANTRAFGINDEGIIVGDVSDSTSGSFRGFVYKSEKCTVFNYPKVASTSASRSSSRKCQFLRFLSSDATQVLSLQSRVPKTRCSADLPS